MPLNEEAWRVIGSTIGIDPARQAYLEALHNGAGYRQARLMEAKVGLAMIAEGVKVSVMADPDSDIVVGHATVRFDKGRITVTIDSE